MSQSSTRLQVPIPWRIVFGLVIVSVVVLLLPSKRVKEMQLARERLRKFKGAPAAVVEAFRSGRAVPFDARPSGNFVTLYSIWNPKSGRFNSDYEFGMPTLGNLANLRTSPSPYSHVGTPVVYFAPDPTSSGYTDYAVACFLWKDRRSNWAKLDNIRNDLATASTQSRARAEIAKIIGGAEPGAVKLAREQVAANVAVFSGLALGDGIFEFEGSLHLVSRSDRYAVQDDLAVLLSN